MSPVPSPQSLAPLFSDFRARKTLALSRLITALDDGADAAAILRAVGNPRTESEARVVGITGPPGAGKSTLVSALVREWRAAGQTVAVLAVDPQSPFTGGALLGDRVRLTAGEADPGVYFRSLSTRGSAGGVSASAGPILSLLGAFGFDWIVIETVGAGQAELAVADIADLVVLVLNPGTGDGIQWEKAGQVEIADVFVLNKADRDGIDALEAALREALSIEHAAGAPGRPLKNAGHAPEVFRTVSTRNDGVAALAAHLARLRALLGAGGILEERLRRRLRFELEGLLRRQLDAAMDRSAPEVAALARGETTVAEAARRLAEPSA